MALESFPFPPASEDLLCYRHPSNFKLCENRAGPTISSQKHAQDTQYSRPCLFLMSGTCCGDSRMNGRKMRGGLREEGQTRQPAEQVSSSIHQPWSSSCPIWRLLSSLLFRSSSLASSSGTVVLIAFVFVVCFSLFFSLRISVFFSTFFFLLLWHERWRG